MHYKASHIVWPGIPVLILLSCSGSHKTVSPIQQQPLTNGRQLSQWIDKTPPNDLSYKWPSAGEDFAMVYDPSRHRAIIFGGKNNQNENIDEVWALDLSTQHWAVLQTIGNKPPATEDHSLIYDPNGNRLILYGGEDGPTWNNLYALDLEKNKWRNLTSPDTPAREDHIALYDSRGKRMVIWGGQNDHELDSDLWSFDLNPKSKSFEHWQKLKRKKKYPTARTDHAAVYDSLKNRMVIYGGWDPDERTYLADTWIYRFESESWKRLKTKSSFPPRRRHAVGVYDNSRNWFIVMGGFGEKGYLNDVWAFDLTNDVWLNITPGPQPRLDHGAIYDPRRKSLILYGGDANVKSKFLDLWQLRIRDDIRWDELESAAKGKKRRSRK